MIDGSATAIRNCQRGCSDSSNDQRTAINTLLGTLANINLVRKEEWGKVILSMTYFFCLLSAYYVLRAVRDEIGSEHHEELPSSWTAVFFVMLAVVPFYWLLVQRFRRRVFIPAVNAFFIVNLLIFHQLLIRLEGDAKVWTEWAFYVWTSVFNLFVVSVFWSFMADLFQKEQSKRLFGFIAVGGTLGGIAGPTIAAIIVPMVGQANLILIPAGLLSLSIVCVLILSARPFANPSNSTRREEEPSGGVLAGIQLLIGSPYLLAICLYLLFYTFSSGIIYFEKAKILNEAFVDRAARTAFFAKVDLATNGLTLFLQGIAAGAFLTRLGVAATLAVLPLFNCIGFAVLGAAPGLWTLVIFDTARRASNFGLAKPAREVLWTVVGKEEKYKSKTFVDTVVYRGGDMATGWLHTGLSSGLGFGLSAIAFTVVPISGIWIAMAWFLGKKHENYTQPKI